ncbi:MAG: nucleotidyltransferase family protein [Armatimonadota bacterium]|nr:nucleotidyltransferase family protein [Armatimonadota bacterium]
MTDRQPGPAAVVLAAGASTRMGRPKLALPVGGVPMLRRVAEAAAASRCGEVVVVLGGAHAAAYRPLLDGLPVRVVENPDPGEGMGSSIRVGVAAISPEATGVVILLADQPLVTAAIIDQLVETAVAGGHRIVASAYRGVVGPPAYFDRALFLELLTLEGDRGARSVIERYPQQGVALPLPEEAAVDVDVPEDLPATGAEP